MLRNANTTESEILLGNTQLIGLFFLLAVLLGVAFTAGFMLGHGSFGKKAEAVAAAAPGPPSDAGARTAVVEPAPTAGNHHGIHCNTGALRSFRRSNRQRVGNG